VRIRTARFSLVKYTKAKIIHLKSERRGKSFRVLGYPAGLPDYSR
jgi:hypothetical protein